MEIGLDEHILLSQIWQYIHPSILKYKALQKRTAIGTLEKKKGKTQSTNRVNKAAS